MADRYAWLSVLAPCLLVAWALAWAYRRYDARSARLAVSGVAAAALLALLALTFERSVVFADSVLLFSDATQKTEADTDAPYQLGKALEELGREEEAMLAFREVLRRLEGDPRADLRRPTNNLARLLAKRGELPEAERLLRAALERAPGDAKLTKNLVKVLRGLDKHAEADELEQERP